MTTNADKVWWTRPGFIAATAFLLLVSILAIWISTSSNRTDVTSEPPTPTATSTGSTQTGGSNTTVSAASPPSSVTELELTEAPANITWTLWQGIALPSSPDDGPADVHDGIAESYTHSPTGALIAAVQITNRAAYGETARVVEAQVVPGVGRDQLLLTPPKPGALGDAPQIAGFRVAGYSDERADLELVFRLAADRKLVSLTVAMEWHDGDWQIAPTLDGEVYRGGKPLPSLAGYVIWAGVV